MDILRRLYRYLHPYRGWAFLAFSSMVVVSMTYGALLALSKPVFDEVLSKDTGPKPVSVDHKSRALDLILRRDLPEGRRGALVNALDRMTGGPRHWWTSHRQDRWKYIPYMLLVIFVIRAITAFFSEYSFQKVGLSTVRDLRNELYESIIHQSNRFFAQRTTGELVSRIISDADAIQAAVSIRMGDLFQESINLVVLGMYVFISNTELAVFAFIVAPIIVIPVVNFGRRLRKTTYKSQERMADISTILEETIKGVRIVKAFAMEPFEIARFHEATQSHLNMNLKAQRIQATTSPVMELLAGVCMALLFLYAGVRIHAGKITQGEFISFLLALTMMYDPIKRLNKVNLAMNTALSAADRVFQMLDVENDVKEKPDALRLTSIGSGIRYEGVSFSYGANPILKNIDLQIAPGEVVAVVGGSGAGKSTLVNLLPRFYDVTGGTITIDHHDVRDLTLSSLRSLMGYVTQEVVLFNDTVRANISYGRSDIPEEKVISAAKAANAHEFISQLSNGYDSRIGESGVLLSGGQRQRLAIARALLKDPPILVLDEATSALDTESERLVQQALANLMKGRTTLVIAHRLSTIRSADRIIVLDRGEISDVGCHEELLNRKGIYRKLYDMQFLEEDEMSESLT
ncbi:MAG TPA: ABC transporter ATP-binding protein [Thermoanaerobaculia bacterium]|nr:ABC transporter ATP-binding protein [Thermoanaerobaculia bacterium]